MLTRSRFICFEVYDVGTTSVKIAIKRNIQICLITHFQFQCIILNLFQVHLFVGIEIWSTLHDTFGLTLAV